MNFAYISEIQRFCVHDGPGIRTTVFFQGCPLHCKWCQNPETISSEPIILYNKEQCVGCTACISSCPRNAISVTGNGIVITDKDKCDKCGKCCEECYFLARTLSSKQYSVKQLFDEIQKDKVVFKRSGGGITISGGEPLLQADFNEEFLILCKNEGYTTAVETAGFVHNDTIKRFVPLIDTFLFDMKMFDCKKHKYWTGVPNNSILENLRTVTSMHDNVVIRVPLIPSVNDTDEEFGKMMNFVASLRHVNSVHILPFHQFGSSKYDLAQMDYAMREFSEDNLERVNACRDIAEKLGFRVNVGGTGFKDDKIKAENPVLMSESYFYEKN